MEVGPDYVIDLDSHTKLPKICSHISSCQAGTEAYVLEYPESACPLSVIRRADMELVLVETDEGSQEVLVDSKNKVFLTSKSQENAPSSCKPVFTVYATEYSNIKVLSADLAMFDLINVDHHLDPSNLDIDLEIRTSEYHLMYFFRQSFRTKLEI